MLINESDPMESLQYVFIMREETNQLPVNIDVDKASREYWDKVFQKLHMSGMRSIIYSKVYLKEQDASIFLSRFQGEVGMSAFQSISKDMQIVQVIGVKEQIRQDTKMLISQMKAAELSLYILSGDELSRVLPVAFKSKILNQYDTLLYLDNDNARVVMKNHLTILSQSLKLEESWGSKPMRMSTLDRHHRSLTIEEKQAIYPEIKSFSIVQILNYLFSFLIFIFIYINDHGCLFLKYHKKVYILNVSFQVETILMLYCRIVIY